MPIRISDIIARANDNDIYPLMANDVISENFYVVKTITDRGNLKSDTLGLKGACIVLNTDTSSIPEIYWFSRANKQASITWNQLSVGTSLPDGTVFYAGVYNAASNTPDLTITGNKIPGYLYAVGQDGTQNLNGTGNVSYAAGDFIICSPSNVWEKINTSSTATSWNSLTDKPDTFPFSIQEDSSTAVEATSLRINTNHPDEVTSSGSNVVLNLPKVYTTQQINVTLPAGITKLGNYSNSSVITSGTSFETILRNILVSVNPATYTGPATSRTFKFGVSPVNVGTVYEIGTTLESLELVGTFVKNDAGDLVVDASPTGSGTDFYVKRFNDLATGSYALENTIYSTTPSSPYTWTIGDFTASSVGTYRFRIEFFYTQGPVKNDSSGQPSPSGQIAAGSIITEASFITQRRSFWGTPASTPTNSSGVRALSGTGTALGHVKGSTFTINIPIGTTTVVFAYPATLSSVAEVKDVGTNFNIASAFTLATVSVADASGSGNVSYNVYSYSPVSPFAQTGTYIVKI